MSTILDLFQKNKPVSAEINEKGGDPEIIGADHPYSPSLDLSKDEIALKKARGGVLNQKPYSDTVVNK